METKQQKFGKKNKASTHEIAKFFKTLLPKDAD